VKRRWKILIAGGIFLVLMAASLTISMRVQPAREIDAYKKFLRDKGEKLELSEVLPPAAASDENSADSVQAAFSLMGSGINNIPDHMKMVAPGKALVGARQPDARGFDFTNSWEQFAATEEANRPTIDLLHQVLDRPKLDFNLNYQKGFRMLLPQLASLKRSVQILDAAAICELHEGDTAAATTNILAMLALVQRDYRDDLIISHLVRIAMASIAVSPTWELLQATNVTDAQLASLQKAWQQMDFLSDAETVFTVERSVSDTSIVQSRGSHEAFKDTFGPVTSGGGLYGASGGSSWADELENMTAGPRSAVSEVMWRSSWSYSAELEMLQRNLVILETVRAMKTNATECYKTNYDQMTFKLSTLGSTNAGGAFFRVLRIPDYREYFGGAGSLSSVLRKTLQIETARRVVVTAIALKRHQLKYGGWPQTLEELAPEFISTVPIDPNDGKPLIYRPNLDGTYLLYSVGADGMDDGGDAGSPTSSSGSTGWYWLRARDWVWPQPATVAEIQYFYEHPPK